MVLLLLLDRDQIQSLVARKLILIITNKEDLATDLVVLELQAQGQELFRLNSEDCPHLDFRCRPSAGSWIISDGGKTADSLSISGVWYRRPGWVFPEAIPGSVDDFVNQQWLALIRGLVCAEGPKWINDPFSASRAESKMLQLRTARKVGLMVPETLITNSSIALTRFQGDFGEAIVKALNAPLIEETGEFIFTTLAGTGGFADSESVAVSPTIMQMAILPKKDIRATVIGKTVFAAEANSTLVDWRLDSKNGLWQPVKLPEDIEYKLVVLCQELNLNFGAIDLALDSSGYWFLEINPSGEWAWIETATGLPLASELAKVLADGRQ